MDEGVDPQNMCSHLYGAMGILHELSAHASEGLVVIFQEWLEAVEHECAAIMAGESGCSSENMAHRLGISRESAGFIMDRIRKKDKSL